MDRASRERLKWKCRRGLLELDLVLARYLERYPEDPALLELLDLPDRELWEIVSGGSERFEERHRGVVERLRSS